MKYLLALLLITFIIQYFFQRPLKDSLGENSPHSCIDYFKRKTNKERSYLLLFDYVYTHSTLNFEKGKGGGRQVAQHQHRQRGGGQGRGFPLNQYGLPLFVVLLSMERFTPSRDGKLSNLVHFVSLPPDSMDKKEGRAIKLCLSQSCETVPLSNNGKREIV